MKDRMERTVVLLTQVKRQLETDPKWAEHIEEIDFLIADTQRYLQGQARCPEKQETEEMSRKEVLALLESAMRLFSTFLGMFW